MVMDDYQKYIHLSRYARWREDLGRRETWPETVDRYMSFFIQRYKDLEDPRTNEFHWFDLAQAIKDLEVMPSMRCLMTAGPALERDNVAGYNCSYIVIDTPRAFDEMMYILMCGTGVGFSVERQYINKLPEIEEEFHGTDSVIRVADSKIGWASAFRELISLLYAGKIPRWDTSKVRGAGSPLRTFGGRASGPGPLEELFEFACRLFKGAAGRRLNSLECHDLCCKIADIVVVGGVRRSALISLSNLTDERMRNAKQGQWWEDNPQRALANNSVCYTEKPDMGIFMKEWSSLYESKSGERGIFYRGAAQKAAARSGRRDVEHEFGTNPCSEIILRPKQFCNLTEVVVRNGDTFASLKRKVALAAFLGTLQSTLTNFRYLSKAWQRNTEEERLLGVSLTGIMDHPILAGNRRAGSFENGMHLKEALEELKSVAIETNKRVSERLGISPSSAITCVKPSGTVSQLVNSSSGIHPRYSQFYIRRVRADNKDPLSKFMQERGYPVEEDVMKPGSGLIFSFPIKSPDRCVTRNSMSAIEQLELWKIYAEHWCEHKPSITVYVKEDEWMNVGAWVYDHFELVSGVSFLPHSDHVYKQAPYEEIDKDTYKKLAEEMPKDTTWEALSDYEDSNNTTFEHELACSAGSCEVL